MELQNKVAIVTGASSGIGAAIAQELDKAGMKLILTARSRDKLQQLANNLQKATFLAGEITDPTLPEQLVELALSQFGQLDVVINNAGVMTVGSISDVDLTVDTGLYDQWSETDKDWIMSGGALQPEDIARSIRFVLEQPSHVLIPRLLVVPTNQPV